MKIPWYSKKWVVVLLHAAAWTLLFSLPYLLRPPYEAKRTETVGSDELALTILHRVIDCWFIFSFYLNALWLIPRLVYAKRYGAFTLSHVLLFTVLPLGNWLFIRLVAVHTPFDWRPTLLFGLFGYLFIMTSSTAYQMIRDKIRTERLEKERENENLKTELSFLRNQVSPHFMFNVLNNMVALARKKSEVLEPSLIKLSSLLRYMLYETDVDRVPLEKEIDYLQSYIDLQRQRFGEKVKVNVCFEVADSSYLIEPMLLIPFVENAFKHGTGLIRDAQIDIQLNAKGKRLYFSVRNKFDASSREVKDRTSGIGLPNVKRRLNLLYGSDYSLMNTVEEDWFIISLQINLHQ